MDHENPVLDWIEEHGMDAAIFEPFVLGKRYYFRTAVYAVIGTVAGYSSSGAFLKLDDAIFVRDDGSYSETVESGLPDSASYEAITKPQFLHVAVIADFVEYPHDISKS